MAWKADAANERFERTTGGFPGAANPFTICYWLLRDATGNASMAAWGSRQAAQSIYMYHYNASGNGQDLVWEFSDGGVGVGIDTFTPTQDVWHFFAFVRNGTGSNQHTSYRRTASATSLTATTGTITFTDLYNIETVLNNSFSLTTGFFPGKIAAMKQWTAALTTDELLSESYQYLPVRYTNLFSFYPMHYTAQADAALDKGGAGRNFTVTGTLTSLDGPPIPWQIPGRRRHTFTGQATPPPPGGYYLLENGTDRYQLEDASGLYLLEETIVDPFPAGYGRNFQNTLIRL